MSELQFKSIEEEEPEGLESPKDDDSVVPEVILGKSNIILNSAACNLLGLKVGSRVHIGYGGKDVVIPMIGSSKAMNVAGGNLLRKNKTVALRGVNNILLREHGTVFELKMSDIDGICYMVGNQKAADALSDDSKYVEDLLDDLEVERTKNTDLKF